MSEWKKVKIGDFLKQYRNTIYVDDSQQYKQVTISSKSGVKYRCSKIGKEIGRKRQFLIDLKTYPNTVIFTRQGLHEGAIGLAPQEVDGCIVTENMPMFSVDETIVDTFYLKYFLLSPAFSSLILTLTPTGSAQKSIHERDLLPLEISLPDLQTQQKIVCELAKKISNVEELQNQNEKQKNYVKQLRQNILQKAIEGKLTEEWRKENPVVKGNPDFDAEALFEKIQEEKCHTDSELLRNSKKKVFEPILENEQPFEIPEGWKWVRLGEITTLITDGKHGDSENQDNSGFYFLSAKDIQNEKLVYDYARQITEKDFYETHRRTNLKPGDICIVNTGATVGKLAIAPDDQKTYSTTFQKSVAIVKLVKDYVYNKYIKYYLVNDVPRLMQKSWGSAINNLLLSDMRIELIPLPPLAEQKEIVSRVEKLLANVIELEEQITERETLTKQMLQSIMKDVFL